MSKKILERLKSQFGDAILETSSFRGDDEAIVPPNKWRDVATFLRDDEACRLDHFIDITAVDYPERAPEMPRFDLILYARSMKHGHRVRLKTRLQEDEQVDSLIDVWPGTNWGEREVWDMFGVRFDGHPDLRRILLYEEFEGFPLRKDYPIERAQPLVPYREVEGIDKIPPFGPDMGQPFGRIDWPERLEGRDQQVSPAIAVQVGQRRTLSDGTEDERLAESTSEE